MDKLAKKFSNMKTSVTNSVSKSAAPVAKQPDLDILLGNELGRKLFQLFLKELNNSVDTLLTIYLICSSFQTRRREDREQNKRILEKTYTNCFVNNRVPFLNHELKQKLADTLQKATYNEAIFIAAKTEIKEILEFEYLPKFMQTKHYQEYLLHLAKSQQQHSTSSLKVSSDKSSIDQFNQEQMKQSSFVIPNVPSQQKQLKHSKSQSQATTTATTKVKVPASSANKLNKTSMSIASNRSGNLNESTLSLNLAKKPLKLSASQQIPPNPYHVIGKCIPVSAQDSEIQSMVSSDMQYSDSDQAKHKHHLPKLDKHIKQNIMANKNVSINQAEDQVPADMQPSKGRLDAKKMPVPIQETDPKRFFEILCSKLERVQQDEAPDSSENINVNFSRSLAQTYHDPNMTTCQDEHHHNKVNSKVKASPYKSSKANRNSEMITGSFISNEMPQLNTTSYLNRSTNYSFNAKQPVNVVSQGGPKRSLNPYEQQNHHFYQLTSTSKEVDIDSHNNRHHHHHHNNHHHHHQKPLCENQDSGVASTRSIASIDRVSDWLTTSESNNEKSQKQAPPPTLPSNPKCVETMEKVEEKVKTTVAYYLPGEDLAYISTFNGKYLTLAQFKQLITKKGQFRYFFKTKSDLLDEECVVFQEATDDAAFVPMFNNKVIAKIEKLSNNTSHHNNSSIVNNSSIANNA